MPRLPQRLTLPSQTADIILEMISTGQLRDKLPGERQLAATLQIGRDTLRSALQILEAGGNISSRQHGMRRDILTGATRQTTAAKRIVFLSPKKITQLPPWMLVEFDTLRELLNQRGFEIQLISPGIFHLKNPDRKLESIVSGIDADAWLLYQCPLAVQQWFHRQKIPALIRGYPQPDIQIPFIDEDWQAAAFHAGGLLKRQGHRRVGVLMPNSNLAGLQATQRGLLQAFPSDLEELSLLKIVEKGTAEDVTRALARTLSLKHPPTAIVATRSRHLLTIMSWMAQQNLCVPRDLSLITLASEPWFEHVIPSPSHYSSDPANFARTVVRHILPIARGKASSFTRKLIIPEYIPGGTVARIPDA